MVDHIQYLGLLIQEKCRMVAEEAGCLAVALRLNQEEFVLWLEGISQDAAARHPGC